MNRNQVMLRLTVVCLALVMALAAGGMQLDPDRRDAGR